MFCHKCGTQAIEDAKFCATCGSSLLQAPVQIAQEQALRQAQPPEIASTRDATISPSAGFFRQLARGGYGLAKTYWLFGGVVGVVVSAIAGFIPSASATAPLLLVHAPYQALVVTGVWHAASKYNGRKLWAVLAKIWCVFGALMVIGSLVLAVSLLIKPTKQEALNPLDKDWKSETKSVNPQAPTSILPDERSSISADEKVAEVIKKLGGSEKWLFITRVKYEEASSGAFVAGKLEFHPCIDCYGYTLYGKDLSTDNIGNRISSLLYIGIRGSDKPKGSMRRFAIDCATGKVAIVDNSSIDDPIKSTHNENYQHVRKFSIDRLIVNGGVFLQYACGN